MIAFDAEVRSELDRRAASLTLPYRVIVRAKLVLLAAEGHTNREIAERSTCRPIGSGTGEDVFEIEDVFEMRVAKGLRTERGRADRAGFPPGAVACELPKAQGVPLSRSSRSELHRFVVERGVSGASTSTIGRQLAEDAIRPWQQRSWIFPRDLDFLEKAGRVLDLYTGRGEGKLLYPGDMAISADAKPQVQARRRIHPRLRPAPAGTAGWSSTSTSAWASSPTSTPGTCAAAG